MSARTLGVAGFGTFLAMMAYTAPLATLPAIAADLGAGVSASSWIVAAMSVGFAVALVPTGALGDDIGRRRVFTAGAVLLALSCVLAAVAPDASVLIAARIVQGLGAAAVLACGLALIGAAYPPGPARAGATAWWGAMFGAGVAVGPLLMALVQHGTSWRVTYGVLALLGLGLALAGPALLTESTLGRHRGVDAAGALLLAAGLGCLLTALTEGRQGWGRPSVLVLLVAAAAFLAAFPVHQLRARDPMIDLRAFRRPRLRSATIGAFATGIGIIAISSYTPTLLQRGLGRGALLSAVLLLAWSATSSAAALAVRVLPERWSGTARLGGGLLLVALGLAALSGLSVTASPGRLVAGLVVAGIGTGVATATLGREAVASMPPDQAGTGSGINNTSRYVGAALGVTIVAALATGSRPATVVSGWNEACWVCAAATLLGAALVVASARVPATSAVAPA
ncbi:MAG TPA: MFS transporter [Mycobacteriales bacterium]|jgi:MFS family permease|nr:MFS transporter [Mycobacteriales bacterium]